KLDKMNQMRIDRANYLSAKLKDIDYLQTPVVDEKCKHVYQMYTIRITNGKRDRVLEYLNQNSIKASVHFDPPVHLQTYYKNKYRQTDLTSTEKLAKDIITLPFYPQIDYEALDFVIEKIKKFRI